MNFSYLKSINSIDEALFSGLGREIKTKQIMVFAGLAIISLILVHRSIIAAVPFFLLGLVYVNYSDDILPITSYLSVLQQYRKLKKKQQAQKQKQLKQQMKLPHNNVKLPSIPTEVQLAITSVITILSGFYGIYESISSGNFAGLIFGAVLVALGLVIMLFVISPFLNKLESESQDG